MLGHPKSVSLITMLSFSRTKIHLFEAFIFNFAQLSLALSILYPREFIIKNYDKLHTFSSPEKLRQSISSQR
jgi:ABC-type uncharacterized transport system permease subunit